jgi:hypothetical protein
VREESHLDDMRSAIRGDFERLAERRGGQELMRSSESATEGIDPDPVPEAGPAEAPPEPPAEPVVDAVVAEEPPSVEEDTAVAEPVLTDEPVAAEAEEPPEPPRRSFLDRLLGR